MNDDQEKNGLYDDLPMPRVAAVVGWIVTCAVCLGLCILGRSVGHLMMGDGFMFKVSIFDIVLSIVVGTFLFFKTKHKKSK